MRTPAEVYTPSERPYTGLCELEYPFHDRTAVVTSCGRVCLHNKRVNLSQVLQGQKVVLNEVEPTSGSCPSWTMTWGYIDLDEKSLQPLENPFEVLKV
jgi:hypothetical protein